MIITIFILWALAGCLSGVMDNIEFHNKYRKRGTWWSRESWVSLYYPELTFIQRVFKYVFGAAYNAWHVAKYLQLLTLALSVSVSGYYAHEYLSSPLDYILFGGALLLSFGGGFRLVYTK